MASEKDLKEREEALNRREAGLEKREKDLAAKEAQATAPKPNAEPIDPKYLIGLQYTDVRTVKVKDEDTGKEKEKLQAFQRDLTVDDVRDWKDKGDHIVIVTADGKRHKVEKNPPKKK